jgi:hypothetical protein
MTSRPQLGAVGRNRAQSKNNPAVKQAPSVNKPLLEPKGRLSNQTISYQLFLIMGKCFELNSRLLNFFKTLELQLSNQRF